MEREEDITTLTTSHVSIIEVVVSNATPVSSIVGKENQDGCHVAEVTPPSPPLTFHVVGRLQPPLAPLASDVAETKSRAGVIPKPRGHEVSVMLPRAPVLATNRADRNKKRKDKKMEAKLKKRKDME